MFLEQRIKKTSQFLSELIEETMSYLNEEVLKSKPLPFFLSTFEEKIPLIS